MEQLLEGKNVLVTGAGANIGRAIALEMAAQGANIYFVEKEAERAKALEAELSARETKAQGFVYDLCQPNTIESLLQELKRQKVGVDVLVNNVGVTDEYPETTLESFEKWRAMMDVNVLVPLYLSRLISQQMIERKVAGSIVFITSIHQSVFYGGELYSATKASLSRIVEELAVPLGGYGIRVNGIAPGYCKENSEGGAMLHPGTPLRHEAVRPCYIGRAAVYLAADYFSHHTTGTILKVDGGLSLFAYLNQHQIMPPAAPNPPGWRQRLVARSRHVSRKIYRLTGGKGVG